MTEIIDFLKKYTDGKRNTEKVEISVLQLNRVIKALEQESVIDKIRAEIVDLGQRAMNDNRANGIWACRDIIDKYKAESEG